LLEDTGVNMVAAQVFSLAISALLVLYRRFPVTVASVFTAMIIVGSLTAASEFYSLLFVGFMTIYAVGAWVSNRRLAFWVRFAVVTVQIVGSMLLVLLDDETAEVSQRSEEHTSELQSRFDLVCRLLLEKK